MSTKKPGAKLGRPTKKTPANRETILRGIRAGLFPEQAAGVAKVSTTTLSEWRNEDEEFSEEIENAKAEAEARKIGYLERMAPTSVKAATWLLSKSNPQRYGDKLQIGGTGEPVSIRVIRDDPQQSDA